MKKIIGGLLALALLFAFAFVFVSCINRSDHDCELYAKWDITRYPTSVFEGKRKLLCEKCGKKLGKSSIPKPSEGLEYEIRGNTAWIIGIGECEDTFIVIPKKIEGKEVIAIDTNAFNGNESITGVIMPDTVITVGGYAFAHCTSLEDVVLSENLYELFDHAFYRTAIKSIYIPGTISDVHQEVFNRCPSLERVVMGEGVENIQSAAFAYSSSLKFVCLPSTLKAVYSGAFSKCEGLETVDFAGTTDQWCTVKLEDSNLGLSWNPIPTFYNARILINGDAFPEEIAIPQGDDVDLTYHFYKNEDIKRVVLPASYSDFRNDPFSTCPNIESINYLGTVGDWCRKLSSIDSSFPSPFTKYGDKFLVNGSPVVDVVIPDDITKITSTMFNSNTSVKSIYIGENVTEIGKRAFQNCFSLETVVIEGGNKDIGSEVFFSDNGRKLSIKTVVIRNCENLNIRYNAFESCIIGSFVIENCQNVTLNDRIFNGTDLDRLVMQNCGSIERDRSFVDCLRIGELILDDCITEINSSEFVRIQGIRNLVIPSSVTSIGRYGFSICVGIKQVTIGENVEVIGGYAFDRCSSLETVYIPVSVKEIGERAFVLCDKLKTINYAGTMEQWEAIVKGENWDYSSDELVIICSDGRIEK